MTNTHASDTTAFCTKEEWIAQFFHHTIPKVDPLSAGMVLTFVYNSSEDMEGRLRVKTLDGELSAPAVKKLFGDKWC